MVCRPITHLRFARFRLNVFMAMMLAVHVMIPGTQSASAADFMYVSLSNSTIVRYDVSLGTAVDVAGSLSVFVPSGQGLSSPEALAFDSSGNLYAANPGNNTITKYDSAGNGIGTYFVNSGQGLNFPNSLAFDKTGNLYVTNIFSDTISKYNSAGVFQFSWSTTASPRFLAFVPEPSTYVLATLATGLMAVIARRRKSKD